MKRADVSILSARRAVCFALMVVALATGAADYRFVAWNVWEDYKGNPVAERADRQVGVLRRLRPDFLSLQEFDRGFWKSTLAADLSRDHWVVGRGRGPCGIDAFDPVFCRKDRFDRVAEGSAWFHPELDCEKGVVWGVFEDRASGRRLIVFGTHFWWKKGLESMTHRELNARRVVEVVNRVKAKWGDLPVIGGGDLNCLYDSAPHRVFAVAGYLNAALTADVRDSRPSEHGDPVRNAEGKYEGRLVVDGDEHAKYLDHVFHSPRIHATRHAVVADPLALSVSDHSPVTVDFEIND